MVPQLSEAFSKPPFCGLNSVKANNNYQPKEITQYSLDASGSPNESHCRLLTIHLKKLNQLPFWFLLPRFVPV